jgi:hypothetical protein
MHVVKTLCCAVAISLVAAVGANADEWNKRTYLTFSGPVQIPGATLPAGTYLFQLADPDNSRHVVMIASKDGSKVYGMFITIPNDRLDAPDDNVVLFGESPRGTPQAVQAWWYPGERIGEEFVYPRNQATAIAKANHKAVLATETAANASASESDRMASLRGSKVGRVDESGAMKGDTENTVVGTTASNSAQPQAKAQSTTAAATTTAPSNTVDGRDAKTTGTSGRRSSRKTLPRTASDLALFELLSGLALAGAYGVRRIRSAEAQ